MNVPMTWKDAAEKWLHETKHKRSHRDDRHKLDWIGQRWNGRNLADITRDDVTALADEKALTVKLATVNRYLALIRSILRRAEHEWCWIERAPHIRLQPERLRRVRWLKPDQAKTLLAELPSHQQHAAIFALSTGLRAGNVVCLKWNQVDLGRRVLWLYGDQTKNGEDLSVSLNDSAMAILHARRHIHREWVFTYRGRPIQRFTTRAWYKALDRAGIENFRWHDLRHTWASWLVQEGVPLYALQEMGGWKTVGMVRKYAHLSPAHNLKFAQTIDAALIKAAGLDPEAGAENQ